MVTIIYNEKEYNLATTLRVAYAVQGQHNHKPYTEVFQQIGNMTLEDQIAILYAAFVCANKEEAKSITRQNFLDYYLDNYTLSDVMGQLQAVIEGITGKTLNDVDSDEAPQGN